MQMLIGNLFAILKMKMSGYHTPLIELVSKELNHFGVTAGLFRQIWGHSCRFVLFCSFWRLFTIKMIKSVKVFPYSFWKIITIFFLLHKIQTPGINMQNGRQVILTPWTLTLGCPPLRKINTIVLHHALCSI